MTKSKWFWLQLFAGEGGGAAGGTGASGGEGGGDGAVSGAIDGVDAEHQRLRELGVPEEKLRKRAKRANAKLPEGAVRTAPSQAQEQKPQEQVATAEENPTEEKTEDATPARMSWDEIMADPEYNKQMQMTVQSRLRSAKDAEESLAKLAPALELLARKHGQDPAKIDYEALAKSISDDDAYYEDKALEMGVTLEAAKRIDQQERDTARQQKQEAMNLEQQKLHNHFVSLEQQGEALKKVFPNFDLRAELQNPAFARMVAPGHGIMSVEDAYRAVHRKEIDAAQSQVIAQQTAQKISNSIQAGARRPDENGTSGQSASVTTFDYSKASKEQREALKREIYAAKARGEKLYPGR
jgi:hypothetical protein